MSAALLGELSCERWIPRPMCLDRIAEHHVADPEVVTELPIDLERLPVIDRPLIELPRDVERTTTRAQGTSAEGRRQLIAGEECREPPLTLRWVVGDPELLECDGHRHAELGVARSQRALEDCPEVGQVGKDHLVV